MAGNSKISHLSDFIRTLELEQAPRQVVRLPTGVDHNNRAVWLQPLPRTRLIPLPGVLHRRVGQRILLVQDVIKDYDVTPTARHRTAFTNEKRLTAMARVPPAGRLAVSR
jgi:hypothetical protein